MKGEEKRLPKNCSFCGGPSEGISAIYSEGPNRGPAVPLCEECMEGIAEDEIWICFAARKDGAERWEEYKRNPAAWWERTDEQRRNL